MTNIYVHNVEIDYKTRINKGSNAALLFYTNFGYCYIINIENVGGVNMEFDTKSKIFKKFINSLEDAQHLSNMDFIINNLNRMRENNAMLRILSIRACIELIDDIKLRKDILHIFKNTIQELRRELIYEK